MSHYKPYPAYRDSGVEWLGQVPEHWVTKKLLYWISGYGSGTTPSSEDEYSTDGLPWVTTGELRENTVFSTEKCVTHDALKNNSALKLHPAGSLVIAMYGATVGRLGVLGIDATLNQACFAIHPNERVRIPFLRNWFEGFRTELVGLATGAGQPNISGDKIRNLLLPCPQDLSEQAAIIAHLDRETARIDALIAKKTRFIELLRVKRQALITHAVTKGLDPYVKMKDSGVEWLGDVPEHWVCKKLMYWMDGYGSGTTPSKEDDYCVEGGLPWVTTGELREGLISETDKRVTDVALSEYSALKAHPVGSLVIAMYGATVGRLGLLGVPAALNQACFAIHPCKAISIRLLRWWFEGFRAELIELAAGAGQPNISGDKIRNLFIAAPLSLAEQEQIADQIESRALRIDGLVSKTERSIDLLKERRSALITAAVTGQIDLREAV